jgi:hypothetical protein
MRLTVSLALASLGACATPQATGFIGGSPVRGTPGIAIERIERAASDGKPQVWTVARLDLARVRLRVSPGDRSAGGEFVARTTTQALQSTGAVLAVNGGFYALPSGPGVQAGRALDVMGASISEGRADSEPQSGGSVLDATVCVKEAAVRIVDGQTCPPFTRNAMTAGPWLLRDGADGDWSRPAPGFAFARHPRTAIALSADGRTGWLVVVDGRQSTSAGATLKELADFLRGLGADDALNLDGGGSTAMAVRARDGAAVVANSPIEAGVQGRERAVANHLLVWPRKPSRGRDPATRAPATAAAPSPR